MTATQQFLKEKRIWVVLGILALAHFAYYFFVGSYEGKSQLSSKLVISFLILALFTYTLERIQRFFHSKSALNGSSAGMTLLFSLVSTLSFIGLSNNYSYKEIISSTDPNYFLGILIYFLLTSCYFLVVTLIFWTDKHVILQEETKLKLIKRERELTKAELSNIQEQFRPHFLFNSLNSISALTAIDPEKAREMTISLSDFFRQSLEKHREEFTTIQKELEFIQLYLQIEQVRFGDRLVLKEEHQEYDPNFPIPSLLLQPLVENAIKHGLYESLDQCTIQISLFTRDSNLCIRISNPTSSDSSAKKGSGYGLSSIDKKLSLLYGRSDLMQIQKTSDEFIVELQIPPYESSNH